MKILIDIGHPAHVHHFKNMIWSLQEKGYEVQIVTTDKDVSLSLLNAYGFNYDILGKNQGGSLVNKAFLYFRSIFPILKIAMHFRPDMFISRGSPSIGVVSKILRKPHICFSDTEHATLSHALSFPFADVICTPSCFRKDLGKKQVRYNGYHELAYLHPNYFKPDSSMLGDLGLKEGDKFVIVRFVAWTASHDIGQHGFDMTTKRQLIKELEKYARVFITSESSLPAEFERHGIATPPEKLHDLLYYATLYIGEGGTTGTEAAILGTPSIHVSTTAQHCGNFEDLHKNYGLIYTYSNQEQALKKALELLGKEGLKEEWQHRREKMLVDKIDVTQFMVDFVDNYPKSFDEAKKEGSWKFKETSL